MILPETHLASEPMDIRFVVALFLLIRCGERLVYGSHSAGFPRPIRSGNRCADRQTPDDGWSPASTFPQAYIDSVGDPPKNIAGLANCAHCTCACSQSPNSISLGNSQSRVCISESETRL